MGSEPLAVWRPEVAVVTIDDSVVLEDLTCHLAEGARRAARRQNAILETGPWNLKVFADLPTSFRAEHDRVEPKYRDSHVDENQDNLEHQEDNKSNHRGAVVACSRFVGDLAEDDAVAVKGQAA